MANSKPIKNSKEPKPLKEKMSPQKKKRLYWGGGIAFFFLIIVMAFMPAQGSIRYGICRVYVELNEQYPDQISYLGVEDWDPVRIFYKKTDPFGVSSINSIDCFFKRDVAGNFLNEILRVDINGKSRLYEAEKPENVKKFNSSISAIVTNPPDLTLPYFSLDDIAGYKDIQ